MRQNKRRLIQGPLLQLISSRLAPRGYLHCATDWEEYAVQMLEVLSREPILSNATTDASEHVSRPEFRDTTEFENRRLRLGHGVSKLVFEKLG